MPEFVLSRRGVLRGSLVAGVGVIAGYLAVRVSGAAGGDQGSNAANAYGASTTAAGRLLIRLDQVPPGGGVVLPDEKTVLTRTSAGDVHAFSAVCTHQGCTVDRVADGTIDCPCHGSRFDANTGAVRNGPAASPLPPVAVVVRAGDVFRS